MERHHYAEHFGPTVGDKIRLGDTELFAEIEKDHTVYGDEAIFGGDRCCEMGWVSLQQPPEDRALRTL